MKHYTSIEQSKKLLELGLNPETADMFYEYIKDNKWRMVPENAKPMTGDLLCWSLGALLELMPKEEVPALYCSLLYDELKWFCSWDNGKFVQAGDSPIEAAYNMVVWLLENNHLKTESPLTPPVNK